jgi:ribonuclease HII
MDYNFENELINKGYSAICGIDEAGRGPLAGDVFAAAVILPKDCIIEGLNDSKKLSEKKREALFDVIKEKAISYSVGRASAKEIDEINILNATFLAMRRAIDGLSVKPDYCLVDGNQKIRELNIAQETVIKGDSKVMSIAAASILAKVSRDRYMKDLCEDYPQYAFEKHKGYGTKLHYEMLEKYGISDIHRKSFLKKILEK